MFQPKTLAQINVIVDNDRYDMFGPAMPTFGACFLAAFVQLQGGISDTVPAGAYDLKLCRKGLKFYTSLQPAS